MKKWFVVAAALVVVLAIPAAYATSSTEKPKPATAAHAQKADKNAAKLCKAERTAMGVDAFQKKYGKSKNLRNAFGKCVSSKSKDDKDEKDEKDDDKNEKSSGAAKVCKSERASMGAEAFAKKYGTNHNLKNAFGKCVSGKSKSKDKDDKDDD
jgi:hypothetical protein